MNKIYIVVTTLVMHVHACTCSLASSQAQHISVFSMLHVKMGEPGTQSHAVYWR